MEVEVAVVVPRSPSSQLRQMLTLAVAVADTFHAEFSASLDVDRMHKLALAL